MHTVAVVGAPAFGKSMCVGLTNTGKFTQLVRQLRRTCAAPVNLMLSVGNIDTPAILRPIGGDLLGTGFHARGPRNSPRCCGARTQAHPSPEPESDTRRVRKGLGHAMQTMADRLVAHLRRLGLVDGTRAQVVASARRGRQVASEPFNSRCS